MNANEIRNEIRRLEETRRQCATERDAHLVDQEIVRLEAELRGYVAGRLDATLPDASPDPMVAEPANEDGADYDQAHPAVHDETAPAREPVGGPRTREGADPGQDAKVARRRALAWRMAQRVANLGAAVDVAPDSREARAMIRTELCVIRALAEQMENAIDPNYA